MLDTTTKRRIDDARDILVGKVPDPKSQVEQITIALIYKFMDDMDKEAVEMGGEPSFFTAEYEKYRWTKIFDPRLGGYDMLNLYSEAIDRLNQNPNIPQLFRDIFKNAYLPYRDPETLKLFLKTINEFHYDHSERLGDAFEYLLSVLGSQGDAGQFRTPRHIIDFIVAAVQPKKGETICDPACGTAGFLISAYKYILKNNTKKTHGDELTPVDRTKLMKNFTGYDISPDMVRLSLVNMYLHGFTAPRIYEYDTLTSEDRWGETFDVILANPPFMSPKGGIKPHKKFSLQANRSEVLFVDYIAEHINPTSGRAGLIVPEGIIFQSATAYKSLRKMLVDKKYLYAVVSLPAGVFQPYSGVKTSILLLDRTIAKKAENILFVKIEADGFDLGAQRRPIDKNNIPSALDLLLQYKQAVLAGEEFTATDANVLIVSKEKIKANADYNLSVDRYRQVAPVNSLYEMVEIGSICNLINGRAFKPEDWSKKEHGGLPIIRIQNLNNQKSDFNYFKGNVQERFYVNKGDLLFSWSGSKGTSFGAHIWHGDKAILNQHIFRVEHSSKVLRPFLYLILNKAVTEIEENLNGGVGLVHITKGNLEKIRVPLPPLTIQQEIVAKIERYQRIIDGAKQIIENYKPQFDIDPSWEMVELGRICEINPKKSEIQYIPEMPVSFIPMATLNEHNESFSPYETRELQNVYAGYTYFKENDVLLAKVTPCFENGKAGIARDLVNKIGFGSSEFFVLRSQGKAYPYWIYLQLMDPVFKQRGKESMTGTGGLQRVPKDFISNYKVPLPTLQGQEEIIRRIEGERKIISGNKELIVMYELKIENEISKLWQPVTTAAATDSKQYSITEKPLSLVAEE
jgi:type I restriction enzyme M protein